jgi:hypothetical protein
MDAPGGHDSSTGSREVSERRRVAIAGAGRPKRLAQFEHSEHPHSWIEE